jgi:hypothetical protein
MEEGVRMFCHKGQVFTSQLIFGCCAYIRIYVHAVEFIKNVFCLAHILGLFRDVGQATSCTLCRL